jgi:hypothetical protein
VPGRTRQELLRAVPVPDQPRRVSDHHSQEVEAVVVAMTWFRVSAGKQGTHHGVLDGGTVRADCGATFPASAAVQLNLPPGERPSDPEQICSECRLKLDAR